MKNINSMLNKEVVTLTGEKELCGELEKLKNFVGKNVIINIIGELSGNLFLNCFNYGIYVGRDGKDYLNLETDNMDLNYTVDLSEIAKVEKDNFLNQIFIILKSGLVLQFWTDGEDYEN